MPAVDQSARDEIKEVSHRLDAHISTTDIRLEQALETQSLKMEHLDTKLTDMRQAMLWAAGLIFSLILTVLGWSIVQQINANEAQKLELSRQIEMLQHQSYDRPVDPNPDVPRSVSDN